MSGKNPTESAPGKVEPSPELLTAALLGESTRAAVPKLPAEAFSFDLGSFAFTEVKFDPSEFHQEQHKLRDLLRQLSGQPELGDACKKAGTQLVDAKSGTESEVTFTRLIDCQLAVADLRNAAGGLLESWMQPAIAWATKEGNKSSEFKAIAQSLVMKYGAVVDAMTHDRFDEAIVLAKRLMADFKRQPDPGVGFPDKQRQARAKAKAYREPGFFGTIGQKLLPPSLDQLTGDLDILAKGGLADDPEVRPVQRRLLMDLADKLVGNREWADREDKKITALTAALAADPDIKTGRRDWGGKSAEQKLLVLGKIIVTQSAQLGLKPVPRALLMPSAKRKTGLAGFLSPEEWVIYFDLEGDEFKNVGFPTASDTAMHETTHAWQRELARRFAAGQLDPKDPEYEAARIFAANFIPGMYVDSGEDQQVYQGQPVEKHAFLFGTTAATNLELTLRRQ